MSTLKKILFLLILGMLLVGCDGDSTSTPTLVYSKMEYQGEQEYALSEFIHPGDLQIATPLFPYFYITEAELNSCVGDDYIAVHVKNTGPYWFKYATMSVNNGSETFHVWPKDFNPFHGSSGDCPLGPGGSGLGPGGGAWVYIPVEQSYGNNNYHIIVKLCTYINDPPSWEDHCVTKEYDLTVEEVPWIHVYVEVIEEWPCPIGPDPYKFEIISSLMKGEIVELLGVAKAPDWSVVLNNRYLVPCFFPKRYLNAPDENAADSRDEEFESGPEKDTSCPQGEKYDLELGECVEKDTEPKCSDYKDRATCGNNDCLWNPKGNQGAGACEEK